MQVSQDKTTNDVTESENNTDEFAEQTRMKMEMMVVVVDDVAADIAACNGGVESLKYMPLINTHIHICMYMYILMYMQFVEVEYTLV